MQQTSPHNLESFLLQQQSEGAVAESGHFTLHQEKALQKIAEYGAPYPGVWAILFGQVALLYGAKHLNVQQLSKETFFSFSPGAWTYFDFEKNFFDPVTSEDQALQTLKKALWYAGIGEKRPFQVSFPREPRSFVWDGNKLTETPAPPTHKVQITVSHRTLEQGKGIFLLRNIQAAMFNSEQLELMKKCLFTSPLSVTVDSRSIDGWAASPSHGIGQHRNPIRLFGLQSELPKMRPLQKSSWSYSDQHPSLMGLSEDVRCTELTEEFSIVGLLTAHGGLYKSGKNSEWRTENHPSELMWVRHGVVVQKEKIDLPERSISLALHLNADNLPTDFSGFALQEDAVAHYRIEALKLAAEYLQGEAPEFQVFDENWYKAKKVLAGVLMAGGAAVTLVAGPGGIPFAIGGVAIGATILRSSEAVCKKFESDYEKHVADWAKLAERL